MSIEENEGARHMNGKKQFGELGVICMKGCEALGEKIDYYLKDWDVKEGGDGKSAFLEYKCDRFETGESKGVLGHSVRGYDIYIVCDVFNYSVSYKIHGKENLMSPDDHYADLKRIIGATNGKARRLNVIMPMLYEGRQHRRFTRESLDCALVLQELERMGVSNIITFDAHDPRVQNAVPLIGFESVPPTYQMIRELVRAVPDLNLNKEHLMVVSPDEGAMPRSIYYATVLGLNLGVFYKQRDYSRMEGGRNPVVSHGFLGEHLEGKDVIVTDDMISSGESVLSVAEQLKARGVRRLFVFSSFGLFCKGFDEFDKAYEDGMIAKVFTTNLVYQPPALLAKPWYQSVNMSKYISHIIHELNYDASLSALLDPLDRIKRLLSRGVQGVQTEDTI